jgi:hypothetical protein
MVEMLVTLVEFSAAFALILAIINTIGKNGHTLQPQRVPVRVIRRNRRR